MFNSGTLEMYITFIFLKMHKLKMLFIPILLSLLLIPFSMSFAQEDDLQYVDPGSSANDDGTAIEEYDATTYDYYNVDEEYNPIMPIDNSSPLLAAIAATSIGIWIVSMIIGLALYIFMALAVVKIGKELEYKNSWFAWVPILQSIMLFQLGNVSPWLLLIPFVNGIFMIVAIMNLTEKRGYDKVLGLIVLTGIGTYILLYLLAWKPKSEINTVQSPIEQQAQQTLTDQPIAPQDFQEPPTPETVPPVTQ